ncbi:MAG: C25 family cysteine peptidase [Candidatus Fermentibacter sp.]|nr:C25 family cysteine peptidase [Candidatus Fermentibacter sp.]
MARLLSSILLLVGPVSAGWTDFGLEAGRSSTIELIESTPSSMTIEITVPGVETTDLTMSGVGFTCIGSPGTTLSATEPGFPAMPKLSFLAALPASPSISATVEERDMVTVGRMTPFPMQPILADTSRSAGAFAFDPAAYESGVYPSAEVFWSVDGMLRGVTIGRFAVFPFSWDAGTGVLTAARRLRIRIDFGGAVSTPDAARSPWFEGIYGQSLINAGILEPAPASECFRSSGVGHLEGVASSTRADGADLLIMAGQDLSDTMIEEFATAKHNQGYLTTVVDAGGWTQAQIKTYIQDAYDTWDPAPSFVLFVGDHPQLPGYSYNSMYSDNRYACVSGTDYICDIFRGRFTCGTDWMQTVSDKVLSWEFDPVLDPSFWNTALSAGYFQDDDDNGIADRWFLFTCETVRDTYTTLYGKDVIREYCTNSSCATPYYYRPDAPSAGQQVPLDITWDGDAAGINAAINGGTFLVQHRDHGAVSGWGDPAYSTGDLSGLSNGDLTPIVFSINCLTGQFSSDCFSEHFFRMEGGAVAVFAAAEVSYSYFNDYLCYGIYHSFNDEYVSPPSVYTTPGGNYLAGQALMGGQLEMQAAAPFNPYGSWQEYAETTWDLFHVFGDPTMDMRTEVPAPLDVSAPASLPTGSTSAQFTVTSGGVPVEGALVCLRKPDQEIYARGFTDSSGSLELTFPATANDYDMPWMVSSHNTIPETGQINNGGTGIEGGQESFCTCGRPTPNPSRGSVVFPLFLTESGRVVARVYDMCGRMVWETGRQVPAGEQSIVWDSDAPSGVYMTVLVLPDGSTHSSRVVLAR